MKNLNLFILEKLKLNKQTLKKNSGENLPILDGIYEDYQTGEKWLVEAFASKDNLILEGVDDFNDLIKMWDETGLWSKEDIEDLTQEDILVGCIDYNRKYDCVVFLWDDKISKNTFKGIYEEN